MKASRAEYFRKRREDKKNISVYIDKEKAEKLERKLDAKNLSKTDWLADIVDQELEIDAVREVKCPYCNNADFINFAEEAQTSSYERGMGPEILYEFEDNDYPCSSCGKTFIVKGYISEYPIGVINDEELNVIPKEE